MTFSRVPTLEQIQAKNPAVQPGGRYRPQTCEPRSRTAVIVPHRNRETHLGHLLYYLHPFLQRQQLHYGIYVVHQVGAPCRRCTALPLCCRRAAWSACCWGAARRRPPAVAWGYCCPVGL